MLRLLQLLIRLEWPMRLLNPLFGKFNPFVPEFYQDPYPAYRRLREEAPVHRHPVFRSYNLTRYADVVGVLRDPARFSVDRTQLPLYKLAQRLRRRQNEFGAAVESALLMLDPPDHTRIRNLVNKAFTPRAVERLRPRVEALVENLLDRADQSGEIEFVHDFASPLPVTVIAELLGIPGADHGRFKRWSDDLVVLVDPFSTTGGMKAARSSFAELAIYLRQIFAARRREPRDDLISGLVAAHEEEDRLNEMELLAACMLILGAGHETTTNLLGNAVVALLRNPGERKRLQDDPGLIESAVEEFLRYDSPVQMTDRVAMEDVEIGGRRIRKGQLVGLFLGAANHDPEQFPEPERLDLGRTPNRHLSFGHGVHFCLGAQLARLEAQVALASLVRRFPDFEGDPDRVRYKPAMVLRGPVALPLTLRP